MVDEDDDGEVEVSDEGDEVEALEEVDDMMITMRELLVGLRCWEDCGRRAVQRRDWRKSVGGCTGVRGVAFSLHQMPRWTRRYKIDKSQWPAHWTNKGACSTCRGTDSLTRDEEWPGQTAHLRMSQTQPEYHRAPGEGFKIGCPGGKKTVLFVNDRFAALEAENVSSNRESANPAPGLFRGRFF